MIEKSSVKDLYFLSPMQEGMLFHYLMDKKSPAYFEQTSYRISGQLDYQLFEQSFNRIIERYDVLRTIFVHEKVQRPLQVVLKQRKKSVYYQDTTHLNGDEQEQWIKEFKIKDKTRGFKLEKDTLIRLAILKIADEKHEIIWSFHHIIMDGWCISILVKEMLLIYYSLKQGETANLPPAAPYKNYINWLEMQDKETGIHYWERYLEHYENQAAIPCNNREKNRKYEPKAHGFRVNRALIKKFTEISNENNVTMSTIIQTLWGVLLQKYNNTNDVVFGVIVSGRPASLVNVETMVGLFINAIPVRIKAEPGETFLSLVKKIQAQMIQSRSYEFVPLAEIQSRSLLKRELINHLFIFENYPVEREIKHSSGDNISPFSVKNVELVEQTTYDLNVTVTLLEELIIDIKYNAAVYDSHIIQRIEAHLGRIFEQITAGEIPLEEIEIITPTEKNQILFEFNNKKAPYPQAKAYELFENHEAIAPGRTAVIYGNSLLSYGQLNRDVNRVARLFRHYGIGEEHIVGILLDRSPRLFEIIMALWKVGAAYIPMETDYPPQRVKEILKNSGTRFLVTRSEHVHPDIEKSFQGRIIKPDEEKKAIAKQPGSNLDLKTDINSLAYILYTSGSTGKPKGAMVEHIGSMNHMRGKIHDTEMDAHSIMVQNGPQTFDISIWQFFAPLTLGSRTVIYTHSILLEPDRFISRLILDQVTILEVVPSYLTVLLDFFEKRALESLPLKYLLPTGEELKPLLVKKWFKLFPGIKMINTYGPTEASDDVAHYIMEKPPEMESIPLGKPLPNLNMYIVDKNMKLCPVGIKGEVCVSGIGVGRGYLKDEARTKLVFMEDPFLEEKGVRLYKMGDLGCWLPDGNLLFFGRKDYQVKIRGHLIECGEIENRLLEIPHIKEAVVIDREDTKGNKYLTAYLVSESKLSIPDIKTQLSAHLPGYMIPAYFMEIDRIPLTANGKIHRKALPIPQVSISGSTQYHPPRDEVERVLAEIWEELLAVPGPGITDDFFDSGGHSLNGMTLIANIHKRLNVEIPINELFNRPTIKEISEYIKNSGENTYSAVHNVEKREYYPLSSAQLRLTVLDHLEEKNTAYNIPFVLELAGRLDMARLENALKGLIKRHESLRTAIHVIEGNPVQVIYDEVDFQMEYYSENRKAAEGETIQSIIHDSFIRPFDLSQAPLMRAGLIKIREMKYLVMVDIHHIVCDGFAFDIIVKDISGLYTREKLPGLRIQYKDYSLWQLEMLKSEKSREKETYWLEKLEGEIPVLNHFTDYPRPPLRSFAGRDFTFKIDRELSKKIMTLSGENGATLYMTLLSAYNVLLNKYTGQEDIIVGTPIAGRSHADLQGILGMFVNTLTMRNYPGGEKTFNQFLQEVKKDALNAYQNQDYQFEELVAKLDLSRDLSRNPLFDTVFAVQNMEVREIHLPGLQINGYNYGERTAKFDITLYAFETADEILLQFNYCTKLFKPETIQQLCRHFIHLLEKIVRFPQLKLHEIRVLSKSEEERLLYEFNNTNTGYPREMTTPGLFEQQVEKTPDHLAVIGRGQITYKELNEKSNRLAFWLKEKGVKPDSIVGIMVERSLEMIIGIMGIMKAGGAYLPIDPDSPKNRIYYMLSDSKAKMLLTADEVNANSTSTLTSTSTCRVGSANLAYVIYTSGTTGNPKGTVIEHRSLVNRLNWMQKKYPINTNDTILQKTTFTFDVSVWEISWWSIVGAKVCLLLPGGEKDPEIITQTVERNNVTTIHFVPSMLSVFLDYLKASGEARKLSSLKQVIGSGEALLPSHVELFNQLLNKENGTKLANLYGPTEATIDVSYFDCSEGGEKGIIPIGKPIDNIYLYILDKYLHIQPVGVSGELCISGIGLARGYLNRPELTAEKFINIEVKVEVEVEVEVEPFGQPHAAMQLSPHHSPHYPIYLTGDLARWLPDGNIEFLGRIDQQVKVRGFRVELDEIKNRLLNHEYITGVVVIVKEGKENSKFLVAYIVSDPEPPVSQLKGFLSKELPEYMIPSYFVQIPCIPLTPNGKIDKSKLPEPDVTSEEEYTPPGDKIEEELVDTWKEVLESEKIGVNDNFFNIGGDSIKAIRLTSLINKRFQAAVKLLDLFNHNTVRELAHVLKSGTVVLPDKEVEEAEKEVRELKARIMQSGKIPADVEDVFPMSDIEKGMIFHSYRNLDEAIYHDQFVYNQKYSRFNPDTFKKALDLMIEKHSILRTCYNIDGFDEFVHFIHKPFSSVYKHFEICELDRPDQQQYIVKYMQDDRKNRWDFTTPPLCRMATFHLGGDNICALWTFHHAILDGWSNASLMTELNNTYLKLKDDKNYLPGELKISYKDFIVHEMAEKKKGANIDFWKKELEGYKRISFPDVGKYEPGEIHDFVPPPSMVLNERLVDASKHYNTSLKHICFTAYVYMLSMLTYEKDVVVGLISNNRPEKEDGDKLIGCFLNTLPFRISIPDGITCEDYIHMVDRKLIQLKRYEKITFFEIVKSIGERNRAENPIFDTIFYYIDFHIYKQAASENNQSDGDREVTISGYEKTNTLFDFMVRPYLQGISVALRYSTSIISDSMVEKLYGYFESILKFMISRPEGVIKKDEIISNEEKQRMLYEFNDTDTGYPKDKSIHELFRDQMQTVPDRTAVIFADKRMTYKELDEKAGRLARLLREKGVVQNTVLGIMVERSLEMMIAIYGILKSGGVYLPIDPAYPRERIDFMLEDSSAVLLLTIHELLDILKNRRECFEKITARRLTPAASPAYVIYTSGTTGRPKGVVIEHRSLVNRLNWMQKKYPLHQNDTILQKTTYTFDVSVWEIFWWSIVGAKVCLLLPGGEKDPKIITQTIGRNNVTTIHFVPSMLIVFLDYLKGSGEVKKLSALKQVISSGEALLPSHVELFNQLLNKENGTKLANLYGPTEATIDVSYFDCSNGGDKKIIPIGKPIDNIRLSILDKHLHLQPVGVPGELCISGIGLARGYLNRPELTAEIFLPVSNRSYLSHMSYIIYKTGDLAQWLQDGNIEFLGRIDTQVKIRGFRIELGEIESRLLENDKVKSALVLAKTNENGDSYLCAYVVAAKIIDISKLRTYLTASLPGYMIPSYFVSLEKLPLTSNGKVDKKALPEPEIKSGEGYVAPRNMLEEKLTGIWSEVLGIEKDKISIDDNFFQLGGHSLKATLLMSKIHKTFDVSVPLNEIFKIPTIRGISVYIKEFAKDRYVSIEPSEKKEYYPISSAQKRLYIIHRMDEKSLSYNIFTAVELGGVLDFQLLEETFGKLVHRHESFRTSFELIDNEPVQRVHDEVDFDIEFYEVEARAEVQGFIKDFVRPFDLSKASLSLVGVIKVEEENHILIANMHHIISDGFSMSILVNDWVKLYSGKDLQPLMLQYRDYSEWQTGDKQKNSIKQQEEYWLKKLGGDPLSFKLPVDYAEPGGRNVEGDTVRFELDQTLSSDIQRITLETGDTLYMMLLAAYNVLLYFYSGNEDILVGSPVAGRPYEELNNILGMFVNMLVMRNFPGGKKTFKEFLMEVKENTLEAFRNQDYQFDELIYKLGLQGDSSGNSLIKTVFTFQNTGSVDIDIDTIKNDKLNLTIKAYPYKRDEKKFDLTLDAIEVAGILKGWFTYSKSLFKRTSIERMKRNYIEILTHVVKDIDIKLQDISISRDLAMSKAGYFRTDQDDFGF